MNNFKIVLRSFKEMFRLEKRMLPCSIATAVTSAVLPFINIIFPSKIIAGLENGADTKTLVTLIVSAVSINFALMLVSNYTNNLYYSYRWLLYCRERKNISDRLFSIDYETLENNEFKELIHKHTEAQDRVGSAFTQFSWMARDFITGLIMLGISVVSLMPLFKIGFTQTGESFFEKPIFLIVIIICIAVMAVIILLLSTYMNKLWFKANDEYSKLDKFFMYFLKMFDDYKTGKEIRLYKEQEMIRSCAADTLLTDGEALLKRASRRSAATSSTVALLGALLGFGIYLFIGVKGLFGLYGTSELVLYSGTFMQIIAAVIKMANTIGKTAEMCPLAEYYFKITTTESKMRYGSKTPDSGRLDIEFRNVSFRYPGSEKYALKNVNLKINHGEHLAVVGRNGSGKTTFIKLMCRLYDVTEGEILINGRNIKEYSKESLTGLYSVVFQDFSLFSASVQENVACCDDPDREMLYSCLEKADILDRILRMNEKENTTLYKDTDKNGVEISGGEAQKLALARALYKDAPIVVLDEPTAALDPIAENEIYSRFNTFVNNKTAIYISHRLSSCVFCNRIAVFDKAELVQTGTHAELLESGGRYSELWHAQAEYYLN